MNADAAADRDVADDGFGRHGFATARISGQQITDALNLTFGFAGCGCTLGARRVLRLRFARMQNALDEMLIEGIKTNIELHQRILRDKAFIQGGTNIHYLEKMLKE